MSALTRLHLLSGGAAQGLVDSLQEYIAALGITLDGSFGAVGAMKEKLLSGTACDVFISTEAMLRDLAAQGRLDGTTLRALGAVETGVAVKAGVKAPALKNAQDLRTLLTGASEVHCPDTVRATAGIHFARVLGELGIADALAARVRLHPNGMTAMRAVAASSSPGAVGCTQITEILHTPGVQYAGALPPGLELNTVYSAGVATGSARRERAEALVQLLSGSATAAQRLACGFR